MPAPRARSAFAWPLVVGVLLVQAPVAATAGPVVPRAVVEQALAATDGRLYLVEAWPRAVAASLPDVEVLAEWEGGSLVTGTESAIRALLALGYEARRVTAAPAGAVPEAEVRSAAAYDERVQWLMDQMGQDGLVNMLNGLSGELESVVGGAPTWIATRYSPAAGCRTAEQFAFETLQATGLATEYEAYLGGTIYGVYAAPDHLGGWFCGSGGRVDHTGDGGASFASQASGTAQDCWDVCSPAPDTLWMVGLAGTIRRSNDGGANWAAQTSGTSLALYGVHFPSTSVGWAVGDGGRIQRTVNGGAGWSAQTSTTTNRLYAVHFVSADSGWACGRNGTIVRTVNGGTDWATVTTPTAERLYGVRFADPLNGWAVGWGGTILRSTNGGASWTRQTSPPNVYLYGVDAISATEAWVAGWGGTVLHTTDGGANWTVVPVPTTADFYSLDFSDGLHGWVAGAGVVLRTEDGGQSWTTQSGRLAGSWRNVIATRPGSTRPGRQVLLTAHLDDTSGNPMVDAPGADDNGSGTVAVLRAAQIMAAMPFEKTVRFVCFTGEEQGLVGSGVYASNAAARGDTIDGVVNLDMIAYESNDQDVVELHAGTGASSGAVADAFLDVNTTYALGLLPEKLTTTSSSASDHASFWDAGYPAILGIEDFQDFTPHYHTVNDRVSTLDAGYFTRFARAALGTVAVLAGPAWTVGVDEAAPPALLLSAGPNPVRGGATLRFALRTPGELRVELFDAQGRLLRRLGGPRSAGVTELRWDGRDEAGTPVAPGLVFVRARAGAEAAAARLVVLH